MDAAELRALQASIKERYKADPKAGLITLKAKGTAATFSRLRQGLKLPV